MKLDGGEAIRLFVKRSAQGGNFRLEHAEYDRDDFPIQGYSAIASTAGQAAQQQAKIGIHWPERRLDQLIFRISIQNTDPTQFSPRPVESWTEIQPLDGSDKPVGPPYTFFDQDFELGQPVPVLLCNCPAWPGGARMPKTLETFTMWASGSR